MKSLKKHRKVCALSQVADYRRCEGTVCVTDTLKNHHIVHCRKQHYFTKETY